MLGSRQGSSNNSEGNNRESSLDDSGVVDDHEDHEDGDLTSEDVAPSVVHVCAPVSPSAPLRRVVCSGACPPGPVVSQSLADRGRRTEAEPKRSAGPASWETPPVSYWRAFRRGEPAAL